MTSSKVWTPPAIPARRPGWEHGYAETLQRHVDRAFEWGVSDCLIVPADLCLAMTGVDPMRRLRRYRGEIGAMRLMARLGYRTVEDALAAVFADVHPLRARRGDCGVLLQSVDGQPWLSTLIVMGDRAVGKGPRGPVVVATGALKRTFAIGAL